ncbi:MAG: putative lipoprotein [Pedosphaera sp.]|nr:putative lipoprotein [Pedosphaera sp.]
MFKKNLNQDSTSGSTGDRRPCGIGAFSCLLLLASLCILGCQAIPPMPAVNLSESGWTTHQGQVVWRSKTAAPEIAGELVVASNPDGRTFVQFTKTPLPFIVAQATTNTWQIHIIPNNKTYSGHGLPPSRLSWLYLPRCLSGYPPPKFWSWHQTDANGWRLENSLTGEFLEGYLTP